MKSPAPALLLLAAAALSACTPRAGVVAADVSAAFGTRLGESATLGGRVVTPLAVLEDSRCPSGAQCIQAGTVRLRVRVQRGPETSVTMVGLHSPADVGGAWLHLAGVCPYPRLERPIAPLDYGLIFVFGDSPALPSAPIACPAR